MENNNSMNQIVDKQQRKEFRKKKVLDKLNDVIQNNEQIESTIEEQQSSAFLQIQESMANLDIKRYQVIKDITTIRLNSDKNEIIHRSKNKKLKEERNQILQHQTIISSNSNIAIEAKWNEILQKEIPQEIYNGIQNQLIECNKAIKSKDEIILEFKRQLREKDEEYVSSIRQHSEDIEELIKKIQEEFQSLQIIYDDELKKIEEAFINERNQIINENSLEIESMFDIRRNKETFYKESKQKREEEYQKEIDDLITKGTDECNKLKIELELKVQLLKKQLEEIRATYQLNTEKLDYNFRILTEKDLDKKEEFLRYKRREAKLKDILSLEISKHNDVEKHVMKINKDLTEDYRILTQKYKELQSKFRHFEIADTGKYDEVWSMHEEVVKEKLDQLLKANRIISEQLLGWKWVPPNAETLELLFQKRDQVAGTLNDTERDDYTKGGSTQSAYVRKVSGARVRAVLKMLLTEAGFLIDQETLSVIDSLSNDEADMAKAEYLLRVLGVKSEESLRTLISYFFNEKDNDLNDEYQEETEKELLFYNPPEDVLELKGIIKPEKVIEAVKTFIEDVAIDCLPANSKKDKTTLKLDSDDERIAQKRLNRMKSFWNQLSEVVPNDSFKAWLQLENDYKSLRELLKRRSNTIKEVDELNKENLELKSLLNTYLGDNKTNGLFQVPPINVMKVKESFNKTSTRPNK